MRLIITGASGFVGQNLVPYLLAEGVDLLLVGRDKSRLQELFPEIKSTDYTHLVPNGVGFDALLHLAILNNDQEGDLDTFRKVNVNLLRDVVASCQQIGIPRLIYTGSIHTDQKDDSYTISKREADAYLASIKDLKIDRLVLAPVYGNGDLAGRLSALNRVPKFVREPLFKLLQSLKPTLHVSRLASRITKIQDDEAFVQELLTDKQSGNWVYDTLKYIIDLSFAFAVLISIGWLLLIVWLTVKVTSKGPGIFAQERVGRSGKPFILYKFRTMSVGTAQLGTHEIAASAVTPIGGFLRASKIDELPQIFNILKNEISLVGPRPCLPNQTLLIDERNKRGVLDMKPGISGYSQVLGIDMSQPEKLATMDAFYFDRRTLILDLKIMAKTVLRKGVVVE